MKLTEIIENEYSNPELSIERIGEQIGMSRSLLNKKCNALIGKNPIELLQEVRMNNAINLLKNTDMTISDVAFAVGYNDSGYFSTRFKTFTGMSPREMRN